MQCVPFSRLAAAASRLEQLPGLMTRMEKSGVMTVISQAVAQVAASEAGRMSSADVKGCLRMVMELVVEETFRGCEETGTPGKTASTLDSSRAPATDRPTGDDPSSLIPVLAERLQDHAYRPIPPNQLHHSHSHSSQQSVKRPSSHNSPAHSRQKSLTDLSLLSPKGSGSLSKSVAEGLREISDFSVPVPTAVFTRATRKTMEVKQLSPGPAHYTPSISSTKARSPNPFVPHSGQRFEFQVPHSPGPAFYTPLRSFLAKSSL